MKRTHTPAVILVGFILVLCSTSPADEVIMLRSGLVNGAPGTPGAFDDNIRFFTRMQTGPLSNAPFTSSDFAMASNGPKAQVVADQAWIKALPADPLPRWVNWKADPQGLGPGASALYSLGFVVSTKGGPAADVEFTWAVDNLLGDRTSNPNPIGVYLNEVPLSTNFVGGNFSGETRAVQLGVKVRTGQNTLHVYVVDEGAVSGVMFSAKITVRSSVVAVGQPCNGNATLTSTPWAVGKNHTLSGTNAPPNMVGALYLTFVPLTPITLSGCKIYIAPSFVLTVNPVFTDGSGNWSLVGEVPNIPQLVSLKLALQAAFFPVPPPPHFGTTNGLHVTIQGG